jgi:hypothetical protein
LASPDRNFYIKKTTSGVISQSITEVAITSKVRKEMNYTNQIFIAVSGDYDSTYMLQATIDRQGITMLSNGISEISSLVGADVDNYIYVMKATVSNNSEDNIRTFSLGAEVYT